MVRKGWTDMKSRTDGYKFFGSKTQWPHQSARNSSAAQVPVKPQFRGRWRDGVSQPQQHTAAQALQSALAALGPEDSNARAGIEVSGIEACEGPGPSSHSGKTGTGARGHVRSSTRQSFEVGGSNRGHGRVPGSRSSVSPASSDTCQSRRRSASSGRAVDSVSTIHRPCDEANRGSVQSSRSRVGSFGGSPGTIAPSAAGSCSAGFSGARVCQFRDERHWCRSRNVEGQVGKIRGLKSERVDRGRV